VGVQKNPEGSGQAAFELRKKRERTLPPRFGGPGGALTKAFQNGNQKKRGKDGGLDHR